MGSRSRALTTDISNPDAISRCCCSTGRGLSGGPVAARQRPQRRGLGGTAVAGDGSATEAGQAGGVPVRARRAPRRCRRRRDSGGQGRGNQSRAVKIRAFRVREDGEVSTEVPFGPFFPRGWSCLEAAGAPDPGPLQRGRCAKNDVGLDTWGGWVHISRAGTPKWKFPISKFGPYPSGSATLH